MAVYVDPIVHHGETHNAATRKHGYLWCHMIADTREELDALATKIGLRTAWRQGTGKWSEHYDLIPSKRALAVKHGAIEIAIGEFGRMLAARLPIHRPTGAGVLLETIE